MGQRLEVARVEDVLRESLERGIRPSSDSAQPAGGRPPADRDAGGGEGGLDVADPQRAEVEDAGGQDRVGAGLDGGREVARPCPLPRWR